MGQGLSCCLDDEDLLTETGKMVLRQQKERRNNIGNNNNLNNNNASSRQLHQRPNNAGVDSSALTSHSSSSSSNRRLNNSHNSNNNNNSSGSNIIANNNQNNTASTGQTLVVDTNNNSSSTLQVTSPTTNRTHQDDNVFTDQENNPLRNGQIVNSSPTAILSSNNSNKNKNNNHNNSDKIKELDDEPESPLYDEETVKQFLTPEYALSQVDQKGLLKCKEAVDRGDRFVLLGDVIRYVLDRKTRNYLLSARRLFRDALYEDNEYVSFLRYSVNRNAVGCVTLLIGHGADVYEGMPEDSWRKFADAEIKGGCLDSDEESCDEDNDDSVVEDGGEDSNNNNDDTNQHSNNNNNDLMDQAITPADEDRIVEEARQLHLKQEAARLAALEDSTTLQDSSNNSKTTTGGGAAAASTVPPTTPMPQHTTTTSSPTVTTSATKNDDNNNNSSLTLKTSSKNNSTKSKSGNTHQSSMMTDSNNNKMSTTSSSIRRQNRLERKAEAFLARQARISNPTTGPSGLLGRAAEMGYFLVFIVLTQSLPHKLVYSVMSERDFVDLCLPRLRRHVIMSWKDYFRNMTPALSFCPPTRSNNSLSKNDTTDSDRRMNNNNNAANGGGEVSSSSVGQIPPDHHLQQVHLQQQVSTRNISSSLYSTQPQSPAVNPNSLMVLMNTSSYRNMIELKKRNSNPTSSAATASSGKQDRQNTDDISTFGASLNHVDSTGVNNVINNSTHQNNNNSSDNSGRGTSSRTEAMKFPSLLGELFVSQRQLSTNNNFASRFLSSAAATNINNVKAQNNSYDQNSDNNNNNIIISGTLADTAKPAQTAINNNNNNLDPDTSLGSRGIAQDDFSGIPQVKSESVFPPGAKLSTSQNINNNNNNNTESGTFDATGGDKKSTSPMSLNILAVYQQIENALEQIFARAAEEVPPSPLDQQQQQQQQQTTSSGIPDEGGNRTGSGSFEPEYLPKGKSKVPFDSAHPGNATLLPGATDSLLVDLFDKPELFYCMLPTDSEKGFSFVDRIADQLQEIQSRRQKLARKLRRGEIPESAWKLMAFDARALARYHYARSLKMNKLMREKKRRERDARRKREEARARRRLAKELKAKEKADAAAETVSAANNTGEGEMDAAAVLASNELYRKQQEQTASLLSQDIEESVPRLSTASGGGTVSGVASTTGENNSKQTKSENNNPFAVSSSSRAAVSTATTASSANNNKNASVRSNSAVPHRGSASRSQRAMGLNTNTNKNSTANIIHINNSLSNPPSQSTTPMEGLNVDNTPFIMNNNSNSNTHSRSMKAKFPIGPAAAPSSSSQHQHHHNDRQNINNNNNNNNADTSRRSVNSLGGGVAPHTSSKHHHQSSPHHQINTLANFPNLVSSGNRQQQQQQQLALTKNRRTSLTGSQSMVVDPKDAAAPRGRVHHFNNSNMNTKTNDEEEQQPMIMSSNTTPVASSLSREQQQQQPNLKDDTKDNNAPMMKTGGGKDRDDGDDDDNNNNNQYVPEGIEVQTPAIHPIDFDGEQHQQQAENLHQHIMNNNIQINYNRTASTASSNFSYDCSSIPDSVLDDAANNDDEMSAVSVGSDDDGSGMSVCSSDDDAANYDYDVENANNNNGEQKVMMKQGKFALPSVRRNSKGQYYTPQSNIEKLQFNQARKQEKAAITGGAWIPPSALVVSSLSSATQKPKQNSSDETGAVKQQQQQQQPLNDPVLIVVNNENVPSNTADSTQKKNHEKKMVESPIMKDEDQNNNSNKNNNNNTAEIGNNNNTNNTDYDYDEEEYDAAIPEDQELPFFYSTEREYLDFLRRCSLSQFSCLPTLSAERIVHNDYGGPFSPVFCYAFVSMMSEYALKFSYMSDVLERGIMRQDDNEEQENRTNNNNKGSSVNNDNKDAKKSSSKKRNGDDDEELDDEMMLAHGGDDEESKYPGGGAGGGDDSDDALTSMMKRDVVQMQQPLLVSIFAGAYSMSTFDKANQPIAANPTSSKNTHMINLFSLNHAKSSNGDDNNNNNGYHHHPNDASAGGVDTEITVAEEDNNNHNNNVSFYTTGSINNNPSFSHQAGVSSNYQLFANNRFSISDNVQSPSVPGSANLDNILRLQQHPVGGKHSSTSQAQQQQQQQQDKNNNNSFTSSTDKKLPLPQTKYEDLASFYVSDQSQGGKHTIKQPQGGNNNSNPSPPLMSGIISPPRALFGNPSSLATTGSSGEESPHRDNNKNNDDNNTTGGVSSGASNSNAKQKNNNQNHNNNTDDHQNTTSNLTVTGSLKSAATTVNVASAAASSPHKNTKRLVVGVRPSAKTQQLNVLLQQELPYWMRSLLGRNPLSANLMMISRFSSQQQQQQQRMQNLHHVGSAAAAPGAIGALTADCISQNGTPIVTISLESITGNGAHLKKKESINQIKITNMVTRSEASEIDSVMRNGLPPNRKKDYYSSTGEDSSSKHFSDLKNSRASNNIMDGFGNSDVLMIDSKHGTLVQQQKQQLQQQQASQTSPSSQGQEVTREQQQDDENLSHDLVQLSYHHQEESPSSPSASSPIKSITKEEQVALMRLLTVSSNNIKSKRYHDLSKMSPSLLSCLTAPSSSSYHRKFQDLTDDEQQQCALILAGASTAAAVQSGGGFMLQTKSSDSRSNNNNNNNNNNAMLANNQKTDTGDTIANNDENDLANSSSVKRRASSAGKVPYDILDLSSGEVTKRNNNNIILSISKSPRTLSPTLSTPVMMPPNASDGGGGGSAGYFNSFDRNNSATDTISVNKNQTSRNNLRSGVSGTTTTTATGFVLPTPLSKFRSFFEYLTNLAHSSDAALSLKHADVDGSCGVGGRFFSEFANSNQLHFLPSSNSLNTQHKEREQEQQQQQQQRNTLRPTNDDDDDDNNNNNEKNGRVAATDDDLLQNNQQDSTSTSASKQTETHQNQLQSGESFKKDETNPALPPVSFRESATRLSPLPRDVDRFAEVYARNNNSLDRYVSDPDYSKIPQNLRPTPAALLTPFIVQGVFWSAAVTTHAVINERFKGIAASLQSIIKGEVEKVKERNEQVRKKKAEFQQHHHNNQSVAANRSGTNDANVLPPLSPSHNQQASPKKTADSALSRTSSSHQQHANANTAVAININNNTSTNNNNNNNPNLQATASASGGAGITTIFTRAAGAKPANHQPGSSIAQSMTTDFTDAEVDDDGENNNSNNNDFQAVSSSEAFSQQTAGVSSSGAVVDVASTHAHHSQQQHQRQQSSSQHLGVSSHASIDNNTNNNVLNRTNSSRSERGSSRAGVNGRKGGSRRRVLKRKSSANASGDGPKTSDSTLGKSSAIVSPSNKSCPTPTTAEAVSALMTVPQIPVEELPIWNRFAAATTPLSVLGLAPSVRTLKHSREEELPLPPLHAAIYANNLPLAKFLLVLGGTDQLTIRDIKCNSVHHHAYGVKYRTGNAGFVSFFERVAIISNSRPVKNMFFHGTNDEGLLPGERFHPSHLVNFVQRGLPFAEAEDMLVKSSYARRGKHHHHHHHHHQPLPQNERRKSRSNGRASLSTSQGVVTQVVRANSGVAASSTATSLALKADDDSSLQRNNTNTDKSADENLPGMVMTANK